MYKHLFPIPSRGGGLHADALQKLPTCFVVLPYFMDLSTSSFIRKGDLHFNISKKATAFLFLIVVLPSQADTLFVSKSGNDANSGLSRQLSLASPALAAEMADSGDVVFLLPGTYNLDRQIELEKGVDLIGSGHQGESRSTLTADWVEENPRSSHGYMYGKYLVAAVHAGHQEIAHLAFDGNQRSIAGGLITDFSGNMKIHDLYFQRFYFGCIWFLHAENLDVYNLKLIESGWEGDGASWGHINIGNISDSHIRSVVIHAYETPGGYGIKSVTKNGEQGWWRRTVFSDLHIDLKPRAAWQNYTAPNICFVTKHCSAEEVVLRDSYLTRTLSFVDQNGYSGPSFSVKVHDNVINCDSAYGIELAQSHLKIHNNQFINGGGIANWKKDSKEVLEGIEIHHNIIENTQFRSFFYINQAMKNLKIYNNTLITDKSRQYMFRLFNNVERSGWEIVNNAFVFSANPHFDFMQLNDGAQSPDGTVFKNNCYNSLQVTVPLQVQTGNIKTSPQFQYSGNKPVPWYLPQREGNLHDAGTDMGWPFQGAAPDIGAYEVREPNRLLVPGTSSNQGTNTHGKRTFDAHGRSLKEGSLQGRPFFIHWR